MEKVVAESNAVSSCSDGGIFDFCHAPGDRRFHHIRDQLLAPFHRYGFALGNLFIIDPLYTGPLLAGVLFAGLAKERTGIRANTVGIIISCVYVLFSLASHTYADHLFKRQLAERNIHVQDSITGATPLNTLLWRHVARTDEGLLIGYFSLIGDHADHAIHFDRVPRNEHLVEPLQGQRNVAAVEWFSKGFWIASIRNGALTLSDPRFGELRFNETDPPEKWRYIFNWELPENEDTLLRQPLGVWRGDDAIPFLWKQLQGFE